MYKVFELHRAYMLSTFYNILQPNVAVLLILTYSFYRCGVVFRSSSLNQNLVNSCNHPFQNDLIKKLFSIDSYKGDNKLF